MRTSKNHRKKNGARICVSSGLQSSGEGARSEVGSGCRGDSLASACHVGKRLRAR